MYRWKHVYVQEECDFWSELTLPALNGCTEYLRALISIFPVAVSGSFSVTFPCGIVQLGDTLNCCDFSSVSGLNFFMNVPDVLMWTGTESCVKKLMKH
jgi:hypothetical protein